MAAILPQDATKTASFMYIKDDPSHAKIKPYRLNKFQPPDGFPMTNIEFEEHHDANLVDLRGREDILDLSRDAFKFVNSPTHVKLDGSTEALNAYCKESIKLMQRELNYPEALICYEVLFRHVNAKTAESANKNSVPISMVHIDHTVAGGKFRIKHHLTNPEISKYSAPNYRWRIVNIWRPLCDVVKDMPLAMLDPRSLGPGDVVETDQVGPHYSGEICYLKHNPNHKWYWLRDQTKDEAAVFVCFDTHAKTPYANCSPHASFKDADIPDGFPPRESVELRFVVIDKVEE